MTYKVGFFVPALKEWRKLDAHTRGHFKAKLAQRREHPRVPGDKLAGAKNRYKIKLRSVGYRLVYEVHDEHIIIIVVAVGRRDRNEVYRAAENKAHGSILPEPAEDED